MNEQIDFLLKTWAIHAQQGNFFFLSTKSTRTGQWQDHSFEWPIDRDELDDFFESYTTARYNLYFCPLAFTSNRRDKKLVAQTKLLWADLDNSNPKTCDPIPQIAWESSPKRYAALWILNDFLEPSEAEALNKSLTYKNNADKGCWNLTRVLRIPGTRNHKYDKGPKGKLLWYNDRPYSMDKFEVNVSELDPMEVLKRAKTKVKPAIIALLTAKIATVGKRSEVLWKLQRELCEAGLSRDEIFTLVRNSVWNKFRGRADEYEQLTREVDKIQEADPVLAGADNVQQERPVIVQLSNVVPEIVEFLWHPYIPRGKVTLVEGDPGLGKSWLTMAMASYISRGEKLPGQVKGVRGKVLLMSAEDGLEDTIRPRLDMLEANCRNIYAYNVPVIFDEVGIINVEAQIEAIKPTLLIVDPLVAYMGGKVDLHKANETREVMARLAYLAEKHKLSVIAVRHLTKSSKDQSIYRGLGSIDITAAARSVMLVGKDPEENDGRVICHIKSNLAAYGSSVKYRLKQGSRHPFVWNGLTELTAGDILGAKDLSPGKNEGQMAIEFLKESLQKGPMLRDKILREAEGQGLSKNAMDKAKKAMGVIYVNGNWEMP